MSREPMKRGAQRLLRGCLTSFWCLSILIAQPVYAQQADADVSIATEPSAGLTTVDWILVGLYAAGTIGLGVFFSRKQESTKEYFVGGGNLNPILIGVSLFATLLSTISYLSMPGEAAGKGPINLVGFLALPIVFVVVAFGLLPIYMKNRVTSAYELLETRLDLSVRLLGATMFLALRLVWMTLLVYLAAKAMTVMMGFDYWKITLESYAVETGRFAEAGSISGDQIKGFVSWGPDYLYVAAIPVVVVFTGLVSVIYTTLGGLRAVVITDFMQTLLLFGGALLVIATVTITEGGFGWFPTQWHENWDSQPLFSLNPKTRVTVVGTIITTAIWYIATSGGDQTSVQRFMATRNANSARWALATQLTVAVVVGMTLYLVGFALLGYFQARPEALPAGMSVATNADDLFPRYISYHLPAGISGLVVAAMFAAAMSSIDSGVNSITAVVMTDFLDRFGLHPKTERGHLRSAQLLAFAIGVTVVLGSSYMKYIEGNITEVTGKTVNLLTTPIFGLFFFAVFVPFARPLGVWLGAIAGTAVAAATAFSGPLVYYLYSHHGIDPAVFGSELITITRVSGSWQSAEDPISFQWIGPLALLVNMLVGTIASLIVNAVSPRRRK